MLEKEQTCGTKPLPGKWKAKGFPHLLGDIRFVKMNVRLVFKSWLDQVSLRHAAAEKPSKHKQGCHQSLHDSGDMICHSLDWSFSSRFDLICKGLLHNSLLYCAANPLLLPRG